MEPRTYLPYVLEREYLKNHAGLTPDARAILRAEISRHVGAYAKSDAAQALVAYADARAHLVAGFDAILDLPDDEFDAKQESLFSKVREELAYVLELDGNCTEALLLDALLANRTVDGCIESLVTLEERVRTRLEREAPGFDAALPRFWDVEKAVSADDEKFATAGIADGAATSTTDWARKLGALDAAAATALADTSLEALLTRSNAEVVGWLHTVETLATCCMESARYRKAQDYARTVMRAAGYPNHAEGTALLALARLEDEDGFFSLVQECKAGIAPEVENSPWFLLARTLLFYKLDKKRQAKRAARDFAERAPGGAYFLLDPLYHMPYLPVRPLPRKPWDLSHQAVYEADGIIVDTPDFAAWMDSIPEVAAAADNFERRHGSEL